jgi:L-lysine 6-transaminase
MSPELNLHRRLARHMLADGMPLVFDLEKSRGNHFVDKVTGRSFLDVFSFFASGALGHNHPVFFRKEVEEALLTVSRVKPSLADIYTEEMLAFVEKIASITPEHLPYHFFIEGGALAVENALKTAFDWKVRKNLKKGRGEKGQQILHFTEAFHGRSGYTLSLTNTFSRVKTQYFPQFHWPRIPSPAMKFPFEGLRKEETLKAEELSLVAVKQAFVDHPDDIAAILIEPIQSEGGDRHFRGEFLRALQNIALEEEALLIFDEVQTGMGLTGRWWCHEHFDLKPDILVFGKKMQVCGLAAGRRLDEVEHVFRVSSRINSTFGGNLTDMLRARWIVNTIEEENLLEQTVVQGKKLLEKLKHWGTGKTQLSNFRGRGLLIAFDFPTTEKRDAFIKQSFEERLLILSSGSHSVRLRPFLVFDDAAEEELLEKLERAFMKMDTHD